MQELMSVQVKVCRVRLPSRVLEGVTAIPVPRTSLSRANRRRVGGEGNVNQSCTIFSRLIRLTQPRFGTLNKDVLQFFLDGGEGEREALIKWYGNYLERLLDIHTGELN